MRQARREVAKPSISREQIADSCARKDVAFLGLCGSFARNKESRRSNIDLVVRFIEPKRLLEVFRTERGLTKRPGRKVELVTEDAICPYLGGRVLGDIIGI